jgi:hypothetical protein
MTDSSEHDEYTKLMALVAAAFEQGDPVPDSLVSRGGSFVRWASPDADIGLIVDVAELTPTRAVDDDPNEYTFQSGRYRIHVEVGPESLVGSVAPWAGGGCWLEWDNERLAIPIDPYGEFAISRPSAIAVRLSVNGELGDVVTEWINVSRDRGS